MVVVKNLDRKRGGRDFGQQGLQHLGKSLLLLRRTGIAMALRIQVPTFDLMERFGE